MEAQRALLDSLMGFNRDGDRPDDDPQLDFRHPRVCKPYLCGLCPRELFQNTRLDAGACALIHSPSIRSAYQEEAKRDFGYERELTNELSRVLSDVERKIAKAQRRLVDDNGDTCPDNAQSQSQSRSDAKDVDVNQKLRVCDVCGAFLSIFDSERRLADHFGGKVHVGYVQIRRKLKELTDKKQQQEKEKEKEKKTKVQESGATSKQS
ncbi:hypothetical protein PF005_g19192 [Phytophthora fragariae]|uniref:Uncharacterized protein n=1 Tax=Phytophthora fragariae TaxID=53985 RepID=A0A6A3E897_9STRA|nr:hypothetical protein PF003_g26856 [Phytophthora fragariae]KAE8929755.1 hypothetical protein PF009_g20139 [Phytophthora fragariae]KAE8991055.1 hypothetical protein PF011_g18094 [Phytophthora fragariae]KAE9089978.1 hypothetical protein PF007_g19403 [Phytophthora fragariae]KAE9090211.1 hypothetical protein PF010_g18675 [Phytophthora fragariae]